MHLEVQWERSALRFSEGNKYSKIKTIPTHPIEESKVSHRALGKPYPSRQILATLQVGLPQQEKVVEPALFAAGRIALVFKPLFVAQRFEGFALPARLLKDSLLLVAQVLETRKLPLKVPALRVERCFSCQNKTHFRGGRARSQILGIKLLQSSYPVVNLFDQMAHSGNLLVSSAQAQLLLVLYALPEMKYRFQRETKGHVRQLGKAKSSVTLSEKEMASPGFCIRNRCSPGIKASALSRVGSLPFW